MYLTYFLPAFLSIAGTVPAVSAEQRGSAVPDAAVVPAASATRCCSGRPSPPPPFCWPRHRHPRQAGRGRGYRTCCKSLPLLVMSNENSMPSHWYNIYSSRSFHQIYFLQVTMFFHSYLSGSCYCT